MSVLRRNEFLILAPRKAQFPFAWVIFKNTISLQYLSFSQPEEPKQLNLVVDSKLNLSRRGALIYWRERSCDQENSDTKYVLIKFQPKSCKVASGW